MSSVADARRLAWTTASYLGGSVALVAMGSSAGLHLAEMVGFLLVAGTFIPLPFDLYVLGSVGRQPFWTLVLLATTLNTVAVLAERWWVLRVLSIGRGTEIRRAVRDARLSAWFRRAPFTTILIAGCTIVPFEPARLLAVVNGYRIERYAAATFLGRGTRFWLLITAGEYLARLNWLATVLAVLFGLYLLSLLDVRRVRRLARMWAPSEPAATATSGLAASPNPSHTLVPSFQAADRAEGWSDLGAPSRELPRLP